MREKKLIPVAMTIAGVDSGGGAGIAADLKTFAALGVHGTLAVTSITAQNTLGVYGVHDLPPEMVAKQIEVVADDLGIDAAKTGMLSNSMIIEAVAKTVRKYGFPLVVDPVMIAKSGAPLLREDAVSTLISKLLPVATIVTPNRMEAEKLSGMSIKSLEDAENAARRIAEETGAGAVIVKGGHLDGDESIDILYHDGKIRHYKAPRILDGCYHGTGCSFSAAIAANLAKGLGLEEAVRVAKEFITKAILYGLKIGKGHCPVNPSAWIDIPAERHRVVTSIEEAVRIAVAESNLLARYAPETMMNIVMALPKRYVRGVEDIAGVLGKITLQKDKLVPAGPVAFGVPDHLARAVLSIMEYDPEIRAAVNVRYHEKLVKAAERLGMKISYFDWRELPGETRMQGEESIQWGVKKALERIGCVPDVIYDLGGWGREPLFRVFGHTAVEAVEKLLRIVRASHT